MRDRRLNSFSAYFGALLFIDMTREGIAGRGSLRPAMSGSDGTPLQVVKSVCIMLMSRRRGWALWDPCFELALPCSHACRSSQRWATRSLESWWSIHDVHLGTKARVVNSQELFQERVQFLRQIRVSRWSIYFFRFFSVTIVDFICSVTQYELMCSGHRISETLCCKLIVNKDI